MPDTSPLTASLSSTLSVLTTTLRYLGHQLPVDLTDELAAIDAACQIPDDLLPDGEQAAHRWYDLHRQGKNPATDKTVTALLARNRDPVHGMEIGLQKIRETAKHDAIADAADGIVATLQADVAEAQETIDEARRRIGSVITETRVSGLSPNGQHQLALAREAFGQADLARRAWVALAKHTGRATWRPGHIEALLAIADIDLDQLHALNETVNRAKTRGGEAPRVDNHDARTVVAHGHRLKLVDFDGFNERKARVTKDAERQRAIAEKEFRRDISSRGAFATPVY